MLRNASPHLLSHHCFPSGDDARDALGTHDMNNTFIICRLVQQGQLNGWKCHCPSKAWLGEACTGTASSSLRCWPTEGSQSAGVCPRGVHTSRRGPPATADRTQASTGHCICVFTVMAFYGTKLVFAEQSATTACIMFVKAFKLWPAGSGSTTVSNQTMLAMTEAQKGTSRRLRSALMVGAQTSVQRGCMCFHTGSYNKAAQKDVTQAHAPCFCASGHANTHSFGPQRLLPHGPPSLWL